VSRKYIVSTNVNIVLLQCAGIVNCFVATGQRLLFLSLLVNSSTVFGDVEVCIGKHWAPDHCFIALKGSAWHNWGLSYIERATRYTKYFITGEQPIRTLRQNVDFTAQFRVTNKGRYYHTTTTFVLRQSLTHAILSCYTITISCLPESRITQNNFESAVQCKLDIACLMIAFLLYIYDMHCVSTCINSWHLETANQTLMCGGSNSLKRSITKDEPHGIVLSSNGDLNLIRIRDGTVIDTIASQQ
jgi:hypothetical protein